MEPSSELQYFGNVSGTPLLSKTFQLRPITPALSVDNFREQTKFEASISGHFSGLFDSLHNKDLYNGELMAWTALESQPPEIEAKNWLKKSAKTRGPAVLMVEFIKIFLVHFEH